MAATQYQIFCRYYHSTVNRVVLNDMSCKWVPWEERADRNSWDNPVEKIDYNEDGLPVAVYENFWIRPEDGLYNDVNGNMRVDAVNVDNKYQKVIVDANFNANPKYDMIFAYDGIKMFTGAEKLHKPPTGDTSAPPVEYYEKMRRLDMTPWFLYSTCASLRIAMEKAEELVRIMGTTNVLIGKVVALDQYIEIV